MPRVSDRLAGEAEMVKSGAGPGAVTVKFGEAAWTNAPLVPVIVNGTVPVDALAEAVRVKVEEPAPVIEEGAKLAVTPDGNPLTLSATVPVKPLSALVVTV